MKLPGPDHPITIKPAGQRVRVILNGETIADSTRALELTEATYPPVLYIPREDAAMALLERTEHRTHCPYKGDASYFSIRTGKGRSDNAIWSYEEPFPAMAEIQGHLAFYAERVDRIEVGGPQAT
jgi:uncharacterized protein (DUF427 family)